MHRHVATRTGGATAASRTPQGSAATPRLQCDLRRRITEATPEAARLLGRPTADLEGQLLESLAPPAAQLRTAAELAILMYERPGTRGTIEVLRGGVGGSPLTLELSCRALPGGDGYVVELGTPVARAQDVPALTERELEVFVRVAAGRTGAEIAAELFLAPATVERHVTNALRKLGARNRPHGVALALRCGALGSGSGAATPALEALRETVETLDDPAALLAVDGDVLIVNEAWRRFGRENGRPDIAAEQNYLRVCEQATADDDAARVAAGLREVLDDRLESFSIEYRCDGPDGPRWFELRTDRHRRTDGAAALVRHRDLTPQRLAERQADLGAAFLDGVEAATFLYEVDGTVTAWMAGAERLLGWTAAEAVGRPVWELFLGRPDWPTGRAIAEGIARTGRWSGELEFQRRDGSTFLGHVRDRLVRDPDGRSAGRIVGVVTDVTGRRDAEREAADAACALEELAETMRDGWISIDAGGRIVRVNGATLRLLGREEHELVGHGIEEIVVDRPPTADPDRAGCADDGPLPVRREWMATGDGRPLEVEFTASRASICDDGTPPPDDAPSPDDPGEDPGPTGWTIVFRAV